jgi:hypothetical protein
LGNGSVGLRRCEASVKLAFYTGVLSSSKFDVIAMAYAALLPRLQRLLVEVGENIRLARLRRKLGAAQVAERAGISRPSASKTLTRCPAMDGAGKKHSEMHPTIPDSVLGVT